MALIGVVAARASTEGRAETVPAVRDRAAMPRFDAVALAGNVIPYVAADRRHAAVIACARAPHAGRPAHHRAVDPDMATYRGL